MSEDNSYTTDILYRALELIGEADSFTDVTGYHVGTFYAMDTKKRSFLVQAIVLDEHPIAQQTGYYKRGLAGQFSLMIYAPDNPVYDSKKIAISKGFNRLTEASNQLVNLFDNPLNKTLENYSEGGVTVLELTLAAEKAYIPANPENNYIHEAILPFMISVSIQKEVI